MSYEYPTMHYLGNLRRTMSDGQLIFLFKIFPENRQYLSRLCYCILQHSVQGYKC